MRTCATFVMCLTLGSCLYRPTSLVVADLGCGDAKVSRAVKNRVLSFDLVAVNDNITACDISKVSQRNVKHDIHLVPHQYYTNIRYTSRISGTL